MEGGGGRECLEVQEKTTCNFRQAGSVKLVEIVVILYEKEMNWTDDILEKEIVVRLGSIL